MNLNDGGCRFRINTKEENYRSPTLPVTLGISIIATPGSLEILEIGGPVGSRLYDHQLYSSFPHGLPERGSKTMAD